MQTPSSPDVTWPIILPLIGNPTSAIDFGCGTGHWLVGLQRLLPELKILGLNAPERKDAGVLLSAEQFQFADLTKPADLGRKFDLAICIELAEHLPASAADTIINSIVKHTDVVLFSGAIPGQGGTDHLNEQWPDYWTRRFAERGFQCFDVLRPIIWMNPGISLWYRQNIMLFMREPRAPKIKGDDWRGTPLVHPDYFRAVSSPRRRSLLNLARFIFRRPLV